MLTLNDGRKSLFQWDTGRKATVDIDCDAVHFANLNYGDSLVVLVKNGEVEIPNQLLTAGENVICWAFVGDDDGGYTKQSKILEVTKRAKPADYVYTEEEQYTVKAIVDSAVKKAIEEAKENGDFGCGGSGKDGKDGFSPIIEVTETTNGHTVSITDANGTKAFDVLNGENGIDGKNGKDGVDGYTPQKGIDYFTTTDKTEMVNAVIATLPIYEGGVE